TEPHPSTPSTSAWPWPRPGGDSPPGSKPRENDLANHRHAPWADARCRHIVHRVSFQEIFMSDVTAQDFPGGWLGADAIQQACASRFPALSATAPRLFSRSQPESRSPLLLYKAWYDVLGNEPSYPAQQIGDCVSFGHGHASDLLQCVEIALEALTPGDASPLDSGQAAAEYREIDTEFIYATSREIAGILG